MFNLSQATTLLLNIFLIIAVGYLLGRITIKQVSLGSAAIFLVALLVGHLGSAMPESMFALEMPKLLQNLGLVFFVTSVGYIAGPNFFRNLKLNAKSYVLLGVVIIVSSALTCFAVVKITGMDSGLAAGLLSGALTSTPGFAAAKAAAGAAGEAMVSVGYGIAYPFGVIGVVLFVQLMPRLLRADMDKERALISIKEEKTHAETLNKKRFVCEEFGLMPLALTIVLGILLGAVTIPLPGGSSFALGNTGGPLIVALIMGHFGHIGVMDMSVSNKTLKVLRELGLILFLLGAGIEGGKDFVRIIQEEGAMLFVYGALMTTVPMVIGFVVAKYVLKLCLFNTLGSITGGMTSTPALGSLISIAGTEDVAAAYAATYPIALVFVILATQLLVLFA